jgi:hypothetical protein
MSQPPAQSPYNSPLLDEIHTHFPAILYTPEAFHSLPALLQYVQRQVRQRYDVFSRGREQYIREHNHAHHRQHIHTATVHVDEPNAPTILRRDAQNLINEILSPRLNLSPNSIIGMLFPGATAEAAQENVVIRPTQQMINNRTEVLTATQRGDCSICQDAYEVGTSIRKILFCQHAFHTACIDTWFTQDVRCPMCRHDIRSST